MHVYIYNDNSSTWEEFDSTILYTEGFKTITKTISAGTNYFNGSDYIYILVMYDDTLTPSTSSLVTDYIKIDFGTDPHNVVKILNSVTDDDDDSIAKGQTTLVVINLNYVRNGGDTAWIPMTQPS